MYLFVCREYRPFIPGPSYRYICPLRSLSIRQQWLIYIFPSRFSSFGNLLFFACALSMLLLTVAAKIRRRHVHKSLGARSLFKVAPNSFPLSSYVYLIFRLIFRLICLIWFAHALPLRSRSKTQMSEVRAGSRETGEGRGGVGSEAESRKSDVGRVRDLTIVYTGIP